LSARSGTAERIGVLLQRLQAARDPAVDPRNASPRLGELQRWQARRLAASFADLSADPRHAAAARFFLDELYGDQDARWRERDLRRMAPTLVRWLPTPMLGTVANALELDALSHELDLAIAKALEERLEPGEFVDGGRYAAAYRASAPPAARERQLELLMSVGHDLDRVVHMPLLSTLLKLARGPASAAGIGGLQGFLERGFDAFRAMRGADDFLEAIRSRESRLMERLYAGDPDPFDA
jgi:hypothetical protein